MRLAWRLGEGPRAAPHGACKDGAELNLNGAPWLPSSDEVDGVWPGQRAAGAEGYPWTAREQAREREMPAGDLEKKAARTHSWVV